MSRDLRLSSLPLSRAYVVIALATAITVGCSNETQFARSGVLRAKVNGITPTTKSIAKGETITHYDDARARVAQAFIPNGALAIEQKVTMASSYHTDPADLKAEFAIKKGGVIKETQVATVIQSNMDKNLKQPMVIALDLPPAASSLWNLIWNDRHFFVVYTIRDSVRDEWRRGIMAEDDMEIRDDLVVFSSPYMGRYEIFESVDPIEYDAPEKPVAKPDFNNPPVAITAIKPLVARPGHEVVIEGKYLSKHTEVFLAGMAIEGVTFVTKQKLKFTLPGYTGFGKQELKVAEGRNMAYDGIIVHNKNPEIPYADAVAAGHLCQGQSYYDPNGIERQGSQDCAVDECQSDQQTGCMATAAFPALKRQDIESQQAHMFTTLSIHGVRGGMDVPGHLSPCSPQRSTDCRIEGQYIALEKGKLTEDIVKSGTTVPGGKADGSPVVGKFPSNDYSMPGSKSSSGMFNKDGIKDMATAASGSEFEFWDRFGNRHTFTSDGSVVAESIAEGAEIFGVKGQKVGNHDACQKNGQIDCKLTQEFISEDKAKFVAGNFKKDETVGTVTGDYPSENHPLGQVPAGAKALTSAAFEQTIASAGSFVFYDRTGKQLTGQGAPDLKAGNIKASETIFGIVGTLHGKDKNNLKPGDIRAGVTIGDVAGSLKANCRNMALQTSFFDFRDSPGKYGFDEFDTVTDRLYPKNNPWTGKANYACASNNWQDITAGGCNGSSTDCVFKDKSTSLQWGGFSNTTSNYAQAASRCAAKGTGWSLPSLNQLYQAYAHGLFMLTEQHSQFLPKTNQNKPFWSTAATKSNASEGITVDIALGLSAITARTSANDVLSICVKK